MNKGFFASFLVIGSAAGLGYWICADWNPVRHVSEKPSPSVARSEGSGVAEPETFPAVPFRELGELDLSRVFEPTGQELDLQNLFDAAREAETLPQPRMAAPREAEILPEPRMAAARSTNEAAEEASMLPIGVKLLREMAVQYIATKCAEIISELQPLKGTTERESRPN